MTKPFAITTALADYQAMTPIDSKPAFRRARIALDLSQQGLADVLGVQLRLIQYWENEADPTRQPNPTACRVLEWMLAGFRPTQFVHRSNIGRKNREQET